MGQVSPFRPGDPEQFGMTRGYINGTGLILRFGGSLAGSSSTSHRRFQPELLRRFSDPAFATIGLARVERGVDRFHCGLRWRIIDTLATTTRLGHRPATQELTILGRPMLACAETRPAPLVRRLDMLRPQRVTLNMPHKLVITIVSINGKRSVLGTSKDQTKLRKR